jgi:cellulose synthase/poly-beta-1,6-N-acetylglucosamine synthase-like glycosyltransferase
MGKPRVPLAPPSPRTRGEGDHDASSTKEIPLNWNTWIRQIHRWLSIIFTATVIANFVTMAFGQPPSWVVYSPLPPLFLLLFSGLYMFVLPYAAKWRSGS